MIDTEIQCYSQRLLNPFRGVVNIIRYQYAEAVTSNGVHWDIYVSNDSLLDGLVSKGSVQTSDIRYGRWSKHTGLTRGPIYPSDEFFMLEAMGAVVYQHLLKVYDQLPFPFMDTIELWLLDKEKKPLALLNSAVNEADIDAYQLLDWRAGRLSREAFRSESVDVAGHGAAYCAADILIDYINNCADTPPAAQWFKKNQDGSATGIMGHNIDPSLTGRILAAECFHPFFISTLHDDDYYSALVHDFIYWQSPWLLLLDTLNTEERENFENHARKQAMIVDQQYLLYPAVIDQSFIRAARVEAKLRRSQQEKVDQDEVMSTFYIELHPSPTE
ncbi:MAG: hypothetical protein HKP12_00830 [Gammaproteobacteria bacterium]|nr:hypothetical protein [Gammaproteobacteria bacterium]NNJ95688.1 hypothetical protein [Gammaproteobacteria bacterium]